MKGTLLATEPTLLDPKRNPGIDRRAIETLVLELLGARTTIWLGDGIEGDDTDGHIDDIARFVAPGRVVCARERDPLDPNHEPLEDCIARLRAARDAAGRALEVIELPMPPPVHAGEDRLPASYANFYVANGAVLVPDLRRAHRPAGAGSAPSALSGPGDRRHSLARARPRTRCRALPDATATADIESCHATGGGSEAI